MFGLIKRSDPLGDKLARDVEFSLADMRRPIDAMADMVDNTLAQLEMTRDRLAQEIADRERDLADTNRQIAAMQAASSVLAGSNEVA